MPVSISYEKLIDGSFVNEQLGKPKVFENFGDASKAIWSTLHSNYGTTRVDFSKPFLLKEYISQVLSFDETTFKNGTILNNTTDLDLVYKCVACAGKFSFFFCFWCISIGILLRVTIVEQGSLRKDQSGYQRKFSNKRDSSTLH